MNQSKKMTKLAIAALEAMIFFVVSNLFTSHLLFLFFNSRCCYFICPFTHFQFRITASFFQSLRKTTISFFQLLFTRAHIILYVD